MAIGGERYPCRWLMLAPRPRIRISEIADSVGIGERAAQKIVADLAARATSSGRRKVE